MALKKLGHRRLVLVVEDQDINRDVLGMILEDEYDIIYATNGKEALESMEEYIDRLSIVLLDLMMPVMDGFEVLEAVRDDPGMQRIPIIVLTADKSAELRALKLGAADFITKPYDMHEVILARVGRIIELSEGRHRSAGTIRTGSLMPWRLTLSVFTLSTNSTAANSVTGCSR